jgi:NADH-quinone oxidoreductase subunit L
MLMGISTTLVTLSILFAWARFRNYKTEGATNGLGKVLENKWYIDELYDAVVVNPLKKISAFFNNVIENKIIDGAVNGVGKAVNYSSRQLRWLQSGQVGAYVLLMVIGILLLFFIQLFL